MRSMGDPMPGFGRVTASSPLPAHRRRATAPTEAVTIMKTVAKRCAALCLGLLSGPVSAADASYTTQYDTCINSSGGGTADMRICIGEEYRRQDSRLNVA